MEKPITYGKMTKLNFGGLKYVKIGNIKITQSKEQDKMLYIYRDRTKVGFIKRYGIGLKACHVRDVLTPFLDEIREYLFYNN